MECFSPCGCIKRDVNGLPDRLLYTKPWTLGFPLLQFPLYHEQFARCDTTVRPIPVRIRAHELFPGFYDFAPHIPLRTCEGDISYKRISGRDSPSKQLPTKVLKFDRVRERHEAVPPLTYDHERFSKKCTSTQTSYTSFPEPLHPIDPLHHSGPPRYTCLTSVAPNFLHTYPPPTAKALHSPRPLNLSSGNVSSTSPKLQTPNLAPPQRRATPMTYLSPSPPCKTLAVADIHDPIEEHFRRSLGKNYPECISNKSSRSSSPVSPGSPYISPDSPYMTQFTYVNALTSSLVERPYHEDTTSAVTTSSRQEPSSYKELYPNRDAVSGMKNSKVVAGDGHNSELSMSPTKAKTVESVKQPTQNVTISATESVDDHFAKSLGDQMWSQLKVKGSVDDHFHKALGDTWLRIKAENEPNEGHLLLRSAVLS